MNEVNCNLYVHDFFGTISVQNVVCLHAWMVSVAFSRPTRCWWSHQWHSAADINEAQLQPQS